MSEVIRTEALTKMYGKSRGLAGLDMSVEAGEVYGFLGPNGAGKTTTIRLLLDVIRPSSGRVEVLGMDPRVDGVELRKRIGYVPGDFLVDGRQTGRQFLNHLAKLRGGVDKNRIEALAGRLELNLTTTIRSLSKGNRQKIAVVQAFMHQPELLVFDEPTAGLDPLMQREFNGMVREAIANGQTVFMSSHVLSEVQLVADRVGIIREGAMVAVERVEDLRKRAFRRVQVAFEESVPAGVFDSIPGVQGVVVTGDAVTCTLSGRADDFIKVIARYRVASILSEEPDLEDLFFDYYAEELVAS